MYPKIRIKELRPINLEGGYLIDGFPSMGFSSVIATESMIYTSEFKLAGIIDSDIFPPISLIKDGKPNYPVRIFVNDELKVAAILSHLALEGSLHRIVAKNMLTWAKNKKISLIISSISIKSTDKNEEIMDIRPALSRGGQRESPGFRPRRPNLAERVWPTEPGRGGAVGHGSPGNA